MNPSLIDEIETVLIDTCILSYVSKPNDSRGKVYSRHLEGKRIAICFVTVGEIYAGIRKNNIGAKRQAVIEEKLKAALEIPSDINVCHKYADLYALKTQNGGTRVMASNDRWIAACALAHGIRLVTHNKQDFIDIPGLEIICEDDQLPFFNEQDSKEITL